MELKRDIITTNLVFRISFNRTFMELKQRLDMHNFSPNSLTFNRTFMELKLFN